MNGKEPWTALVLGSRGDIGSEISNEFESQGHNVIRVARSDFDLTDPRATDAWFARDRPRVGVLIHAAGINVPMPFDQLTESNIKSSFDSNVLGFLRVVRHLRSDLVAEQGRIVVLSSIFGFLARSGRLPYSMSKHALVGIVKSLAIELAPFGVLVNSISPGYIDTRLTRQNNSPETIEELARRIPLKRLGTVEAIVQASYFLASPRNSYITGSDLVIDGGFSIDGGP